jgi:hypothetical protein
MSFCWFCIFLFNCTPSLHIISNFLNDPNMASRGTFLLKQPPCAFYGMIGHRGRGAMSSWGHSWPDMEKENNVAEIRWRSLCLVVVVVSCVFCFCVLIFYLTFVALTA